MYFSFMSFSKNFLHKTRPNPIDEGNGLKKVYILFLFITRILFVRLNLLFLIFFFNIIVFSYRFLPYINSEYCAQWMKTKTWNQNVEKQQTNWILNYLTFNYMWISFQVFISHVSSCWSFYYSSFYCLLPSVAFCPLPC